MGIFTALNISASGLTAQRFRMDIISENIANKDITRTADGGAYRRKYVTFQEREPESFRDVFSSQMENFSVGRGVRATSVGIDQSPMKMMFDPGHPDANADGYVELPNVDIEREMIDMMSASQSYNANVTAINIAKQVAMKALEICR